MPYGLTKDQINIISAVFEKHHEIEEVIIFGSRALGNYKRGSDIDLALKGNITSGMVDKISRELNEESSLPHKFDIMNYHNLSNKKLKGHIDSFGKLFWPQAPRNQAPRR